MKHFARSLHSRHASLLFAAGLLCSCGVGAAEFKEDFQKSRLDTAIWDTRSAETKKLIQFGPKNQPTEYLVNLMDPSREDGSKNTINGAEASAVISPSPEWKLPDDFGPSLIQSFPFADASKSQKCATGETRNGEEITQRNELRFKQGKNKHEIDDPHWYRIRFRAEGDIPTCGSSRWITAQWKYDADDWPFKFSPSPFLSQRFDNGVHHVTVQAGECRCMIAKSVGDPDRKMVIQSFRQEKSGGPLYQIPPLKCLWTGTKKGQGDCSKDAEISVYSPTYPEPELLPDPKKGWIDMLYKVKAGIDGAGEIEVHANGKHYVTVNGLIGYREGRPRRMKFKFGHYRAKIPNETQLLYDQICVSKTREGCS